MTAPQKNIYDNVVIGGGLAGLLNGVFSAASGKKTLVLAAGPGSLSAGSGYVDLLGYNSVGGALSDPFSGFDTLENDHPYRIIPEEIIKKSVEVFLYICDRNGYPYLNRNGNMWVPTASGRFSPTYLAPKTADLSSLENSRNIYVLGISGLDSFNPGIICDNFKAVGHFSGKTLVGLTLDFFQNDGVSRTALDAARIMNDRSGVKNFIDSVKKHNIPSGSGLLIPPILGTSPDYDLYEELKRELGCEICETVVESPAVTGVRLKNMLLKQLTALDTEVMENSPVISARMTGDKCERVEVASPDGNRSYSSKNFTVATGGFYGGGLKATPFEIRESIFGLRVRTGTERTLPDFTGRQNYSRFGVNVNSSLKAADVLGNTLISNVFFAGRVLSGADAPYEHSGNGIALASAYMAASSL